MRASSSSPRVVARRASGVAAVARRAAAASPSRRRAALIVRASSSSPDDNNPTPQTYVGGGRTVNYTAISVLAAAGCAETTYLAAAKLAGAAVACPVASSAAATAAACTSVLSSPYAVLFGLPLPLFGAAAYGVLAVSAAVAARDQQQQGGASSSTPATTTQAQVVASAATGAVGTASAYLMWVLHARLNALPCAWCYASALLSATLVTLLVTGTYGGGTQRRRSEDKQTTVGMPALASSLAAALILMIGADPSVGGIGAAFAGSDASSITSLPYQKPEVTSDSPPGARDLARRLKQAGAEMYGAFWCSHCFDQKEAFGKEAMADFPYVECYPDGWKRGIDVAPACNAAGVKAFPTWRLPDGSTVEGELSLERLEQSLVAVEEGVGVGK
jgi:uncharacterized membrane protein